MHREQNQMKRLEQSELEKAINNNDKQANTNLLNNYIKFAKTNRADLDLVQKYFDFYKEKYGIEVDVVFMHTNTPDVQQIKEGYYAPEGNVDKLLYDMQTKTNDEKINNEHIELKRVLDCALDEKSKKPRGILFCLLDQKNNIQHAWSCIAANPQSNEQSVYTPMQQAECVLFFYGNGPSSPNDIQSLLTSHCSVLTSHCAVGGKIPYGKDQEYCQQSDSMQDYLKKFDFQTFKPTLKQEDDVCYILAMMFCVEMLKDNAKTFHNAVKYDRGSYNAKLPLSVLQYTQPFVSSEELWDKIVGCIGDIKYNNKDEETSKNIKNITDHIIKNKNGTLTNLFAIKSLNEFFQQTNSYDELITNIINGNLTSAQRNSFKEDVSFVNELKTYNFLHNNIIERKSWLDKALSFGENHAKIRRINQLAKIMNNEFTRNIVDDEEGTRANKKEIFKRKPKSIRKMQDITFGDLMSISNIRKSCSCTSAPSVNE